MSVVVRIPAALRSKAGGQRQIELTAYTFEALLDEMEATYPGITERLRDEKGRLRRTLDIYINRESVRFLQGLDTPLKDGDEVSIVPAIAGGKTGTAMDELTVEALVPVDAPAYRDYADQVSLFAMVIPFASAQGRRRFFMAHHRWRNTWELPGGKVEPGESSVQTAERELLEEMGVQVDQLRPLGILLTRLGGAPGQGHLYWGEVTRQGELPRGSEMDEVQAFSPDTLPAPERMAPVTRWVVRWLVTAWPDTRPS